MIKESLLFEKMGKRYISNSKGDQAAGDDDADVAHLVDERETKGVRSDPCDRR